MMRLWCRWCSPRAISSAMRRPLARRPWDGLLQRVRVARHKVDRLRVRAVERSHESGAEECRGQPAPCSGLPTRCWHTPPAPAWLAATRAPAPAAPAHAGTCGHMRAHAGTCGHVLPPAESATHDKAAEANTLCTLNMPYAWHNCPGGITTVMCVYTTFWVCWQARPRTSCTRTARPTCGSSAERATGRLRGAARLSGRGDAAGRPAPTRCCARTAGQAPGTQPCLWCWYCARQQCAGRRSRQPAPGAGSRQPCTSPGVSVVAAPQVPT